MIIVKSVHEKNKYIILVILNIFIQKYLQWYHISFIEHC